MPAKPFLWIITTGRPTSGLFILGAVQAEGWPHGVYLTPAMQPEAGGRGEPRGLRVGFIVAGELARERGTILLRIMAGGTALTTAVADLAALPAGAYEREVASADVLELRKVLGRKSSRTKEEEAFIVGTQDAFEGLREEGRREGRAEEAARAVLAVLRVRGVAVPDAARERILAEKEPSRLERWHERAIVASSIAEVMDESS